MEEIVIAAGVMICVGGFKTFKLVGRKLCKRKLKKRFLKAFREVNIGEIEKCIDNLCEYDTKHSTSKMKKMVDIVMEENPELNKQNFLEMIESKDFRHFEQIYNQEPSVIIEEENAIDDRLDEIKRHRQEIIKKKQSIRTSMIAKARKLERRHVGGMG